MLKELWELSQHFDLPSLGYGQAKAYWQIDLSLKEPTPVQLETKIEYKQKKNGETKEKTYPGKSFLLPELQRNSTDPIVVDDTAEYVFGLGKRGEKRHAAYLELLEQCWEKTQDEAIAKVLDYVKSNPDLPPDLEPNQRIVFTYQNEPITHREAVQSFWSAYYASKTPTVEADCILTGETTQIASHKIPVRIKGVPETQGAGAALSSFDKPAYESYGWERNCNAPIGLDAAIKSHQMLGFLIRDEKHHYRSGEQTFVFWGDAKGEGLNPKLWQDLDAEDARNLFVSRESPSKFKAFEVESERFYMGILRGKQGRIALSNWEESTPQQISDSVERFIKCQEIALGEKAKPIWVLRNCAFQEPKKEYTDKIETALVRGFLFGKRIPDEFAIRIINRICQEQDVFRRLDRAKALSFYLASIMETSKPHESKQFNDIVAFKLGRIAFLLHWAQVTAQNLQREETNVSRSLRVLSTTPAQIFPRLYFGCVSHHLEDRDAQNDKKRSGTLFKIKQWLNNEFSSLREIYDPYALPTTLTVRQQTQFFMGYAMCRAEFFQPKANKTKETEEQQ
jgi:CRISPR-associated protein Cas8c/Csd1 subtype I-C